MSANALVRTALLAWLDGDALPAGFRARLAAAAPNVVRRSSRHLVVTALAAVLEELAELGQDDELSLYMRHILAANRARNEAVTAQLREVVALLHEHDIRPVLLKGAIRLLDGLYPAPSWRYLRDLDLLVPAGSMIAAVRALETAGYRRHEGPEDDLDLKHHAPLLRPDRPAPIELHYAVLSPAHVTLLPAADVIARARTKADCGLDVLVPCPTDQIVHLVTHLELQHGVAATGLPLLRDLLEVVLLARAHPASVREARQRLLSAGHLRTWRRFTADLAAVLGDRPELPVERDLGTWLRRARVRLQLEAPILGRLTILAALACLAVRNRLHGRRSWLSLLDADRRLRTLQDAVLQKIR